MTIIFEEDGRYTYAVAKDEVYDNTLHEELWYAEIEPLNGKFKVRFEDNWNGPEMFPSIEDAKAYIITNHELHRPYSNGAKYKV